MVFTLLMVIQTSWGGNGHLRIGKIEEIAIGEDKVFLKVDSDPMSLPISDFLNKGDLKKLKEGDQVLYITEGSAVIEIYSLAYKFSKP